MGAVVVLSKSATSPRGSSAAAAPAAGRPVLSRPLAFWLVAVAFAVTMFGTTLPTPLYVLYQEQLGFAEPVLTAIFAVYAAGVLAALLLFGRASDQLGRRRMLLVGLACAALSAVAFLLDQGLTLLIVGRLLSGLSAGVFTGTATAALVDLAGPGRGRRATLVATTSTMGALGLGPLVAGGLAQFAPLPLRLPYWVDLGLILLAILAVWAMPETVDVPDHPRLRLSRPDLPPEVRPVFIRAATAGLAGFAVLGLFAAVAPSFLLDLLHEPSHALSGAVAFTVFAASTLGQATLARRFGHTALAAGCVALIVGMGLLAAGLAATSLALVIAAAIIAGLGQGLCMRAGLEAVTSHAPAQRRAGVASTFFIVMYVGISVPVIGVGIAATRLGLQTAAIASSIAVAAVAAVALVTTLIPAPTRTTAAGAAVRA
ncbi:MAG: Transporter, major facilitator family protein [Modestobacter sp.]|nr:Transporter, major facilitator family protein [Modestobacter sp.]